ncbi:MAG TPA: CDP-diacylglycerol--serine O-phosphatidyltransferase [Gemmatimonadales bacterium]|nr:CDP-diacylglycerol--serine O-phosphatidyltransferase [Gemmatimonadales bacterium]
MGLIPRPSRFSRPEIRRVVVVVPSAFTLGNLFFGFWAIVSAYNKNFTWAAWFIVFSGILDMLDGRVARLSNTGSKFGAELDSLIDVISFGVAPAMIMYFLEFSEAGKFGWVICWGYVACVAIRLARYNVMHDQKPTPGWFTGMPSPSAGMILAVYYPFSQTTWYQASLAYLDLQQKGLTVLMVVLSLLMVSTIKYPRLPAIGFRTVKGWLGLMLHLVILVCGVAFPAHFLFPLGLVYTFFGIARATVLALAERGDHVPIPEDTVVEPVRRGVHRFPGERRAAGEGRHQEDRE